MGEVVGLIKVINIRLKEELWKKVKIQAINESKTMTEFIIETLERSVNHNGDKGSSV
jgi:predicted HicB family RNase H-like nuclease